MTTQEMPAEQPTTSRRRSIGPIGTIARVGLALCVAATTLYVWSIGQLEWYILPLGLVIFPVINILFVLMWERLRHAPIRGNGLVGCLINHAIIFGLLASPLSLAAGIFYGTSALLAAVRDYKGCETVAISNTLLRRNDEVVCYLFTPMDVLDTRLARRARPEKS